MGIAALTERVRAHLIVRGRVQGVFFRHETSRQAESLELTGWVRNLPDGSVEAIFEGDGNAVEAAIDWCRQGPPLAVVEAVDVNWEPPEGEQEFRIR